MMRVKIQKGGIAFSACTQAQLVGRSEQSRKLEFKDFGSKTGGRVDGGLLLEAGRHPPTAVIRTRIFFSPGGVSASDFEEIKGTENAQ
jgi:hypothetical protein